MRVRRFQDPRRFRERILPRLMEKEAENQLMLGILSDLLAGRKFSKFSSDPEPVLCAVEEDDGKLLCAGLWSGPALIVSDATPQSFDELADYLARQEIRPPRVSGPADASTAFAVAWMRRTGEPHAPRQLLRIMELSELSARPRKVGGSLRPASLSDLSLLAQWAAAFAEELHLETGDPVLDTRWRIENERLFVWCDPDPVSMASTAGPTPSGIRIGLVYTPIEHRGHGYAPACVAALSQRLLQAGRKRIYLFVDADNPITQVMYRSIGFHAVCDWMEHDLIRLRHNED